MGWGETEAIIGKAPRLWIHTSEEPTQRLGWCGPDSKRNMGGQHQYGSKDGIRGCDCVVEGGCRPGCCVGVEG